MLFDFTSVPFVTRFIVGTFNKILDRRGDDYGEKAVILVLVVLGGVAAFSLFGNKIVSLINQATSGI